MLKQKTQDFMDCVEKAVIQVTKSYLNIDFEKSTTTPSFEDSYGVLIKISGTTSRGVMYIKSTKKIVELIGEALIGETLKDSKDFELTLMEYSNIICGKVVSKFNNAYVGTKLRLSTPEIISDNSIKPLIPKIAVRKICYSSEYGNLCLLVGFEEVINWSASNKL